MHVRLLHGKIQIYEVPNHIHEAVATEICGQLCYQNRNIGGTGSGRIHINDDLRLEPDQSFYIDNRRNVRPGAVDFMGRKLPKLIIETSFSEAYSSIFSLPQHYFSIGEGDGVQAVLIVIVRKHADSFQMAAFLYEHNHIVNGVYTPSVAMSFGDYLHEQTRRALVEYSHVDEEAFIGYGITEDYPPCDHRGMPEYQLNIPAEALWHGVDAADRDQLDFNEDGFHVDLFEVKRKVKLASYVMI